MASRSNIHRWKDSGARLSMLLSLTLLVVLQLFWLKSSWREVREKFRKETNSIFRNTIFAMGDSLVMRNIQPVGDDSLFVFRRFFLGDSISATLPDIDAQVSPPGRAADTSSVVEIFITRSNRDSLHNMLKPLSRRIRMGKMHRRFLLHSGPDTLNRDSIALQYADALSRSEIAVPFTVHHIRKMQPGRIDSRRFLKGELVSDVVPFNPMNYYAVSFSSADRFFLAAITPQIFFCVFVSLLTAGSFFLMNRSIRAQQKLVQMKNDFISNISHELKTPVSTVSVALEALEKFKALDDPQKTNEYLLMARNELNRLSVMTDRILQSAAFENRKAVMKIEDVDLFSELNDVLESFKLVLNHRKIKLRFESHGSTFNVQASRQHLVAVVFNVLDNAIKYSPDESSITVQLSDRGNDVMVSVRDCGMGIPEAYHRKVFEKFFRVPSGDVHNIKGYGLGLSYVASVIESHKGKIELESEVGKGTCFSFSLPKNSAL